MLWWTLRKLKSPNAETRRRAALALGNSRNTQAVAPLIAALKDNNSDVCKAATQALGEIGDPRAANPLVTELLYSGSRRETVAEALVKIGAAAVEPLIDVVKNEVSGFKEEAAQVLGAIGDPRAVETLMAALKFPLNSVQEAAAEALVKIGAAAVEPLISTLKDSSSDGGLSSYGRVAEILGKIGDLRAVEPLVATFKGHGYVSEAVAEALGKIGGPRALEALVDVLLSKTLMRGKPAAEALRSLGWQPADDTQRALLAVALEQWDVAVRFGTVAVEPLIVTLQDGARGVREKAATALGQIGDARAADPLIAALTSKEQFDNEARKAAAEALGEIGDVRAVEPLIAALKSGNLEGGTAGKALVKFGGAAVEPLISALKYESGNVRERVVRALGKLGAVQAVEPLVDALKDKDGDVRKAAAEVLLISLGWQPADDTQRAFLAVARQHWNLAIGLGIVAVEPLSIALQDWRIREIHPKLATALGQIGDARAVDPLIEALKESDSNLKSAAVEALGVIGDARAVKPLIAALRDWNADVRKRAEEALAKLSNVSVDPFIDAFTDNSPVTRKSAAEALLGLGWKPSDDKQRALLAVAQEQWDEAVRLGTTAVEPLLVALQNWRVGKIDPKVATALGEIGDAGAVEPLMAALKGKHRPVCQAAAKALVRIGDAAVAPLIAVLKDWDSVVRKAAAEALGEIGNVRAVEPLVAMLKDESRNVRKATAEALSALGWKPADDA